MTYFTYFCLLWNRARRHPNWGNLAWLAGLSDCDICHFFLLLEATVVPFSCSGHCFLNVWPRVHCLWLGQMVKACAICTRMPGNGSGLHCFLHCLWGVSFRAWQSCGFPLLRSVERAFANSCVLFLLICKDSLYTVISLFWFCVLQVSSVPLTSLPFSRETDFKVGALTNSCSHLTKSMLDLEYASHPKTLPRSSPIPGGRGPAFSPWCLVWGFICGASGIWQMV